MTGSARIVMLTTLAPITPVHAASSAHQTIDAKAIAPFIGPNIYIMERNIRSEMPDFPRKVAIRMKLMIAIRI